MCRSHGPTAGRTVSVGMAAVADYQTHEDNLDAIDALRSVTWTWSAIDFASLRTECKRRIGYFLLEERQ